MPEIRFTITLESDAEPGTGFGTELIDDVVPRRSDGTPCLPGSHLKGLMREAFRDVASQRGWTGQVEQLVFGDEGRDGSDGRQGLLRVGHAVMAPSTGARIGLVSRTAIGPHGRPRDGSLRTVECVPAGTRFVATARLGSGADAIATDVVRLALLSIGAVGGNRRRGSGACTIAIDGDDALKPSTILRRLDAAIGGRDFAAPRRAVSSDAAPSAGRPAFIELTFRALDPVCCPTVPLTGTNVMRGGFAIPASAVQGALLHLLDRVDHDAASRLFASPAFRAWPLLPCAREGEDPGDAMPIWTSLTHRMSKTAAGVESAPFEAPMFRDRLVAPYRWQEVPSGAPLKAADGVLVASSAGVRLWRAADMPRSITAHVNLQAGQPILFTVEAMAPVVYRGLLAVPEEFAERIVDLLRSEPDAAFGRARTVRGGGRLEARSLDLARRLTDRSPSRVFVVQSPLAIPREWTSDGGTLHGGEILRRLVDASGLGRAVEAEATVEFRFGWNRHGAGRRVAATNRLAAEAVIAPGSAFSLAEPLGAQGTALLETLARGIGGGRERGFGAFLPHPGVADSIFRGAPSIPAIGSRDQAGRLASELAALSRDCELSTSAIAQLVRFARGGPGYLGEYIKRQQMRPSRSWDRWKPVAKRLLEITEDRTISDETRARAFRGWTDATNAKGGLT